MENANKHKSSKCYGIGLVTLYPNQVAIGQYNEITSDSSNYAVMIGAGTKEERKTVIKINRQGEIIQGGGEVYMVNQNTGDITPVYMLGSDNRIKKVNLSK